MPSLIRFLVICGILAGLGYGSMFWLANFVEPNSREMSIRIPAKDLPKR